MSSVGTRRRPLRAAIAWLAVAGSVSLAACGGGGGGDGTTDPPPPTPSIAISLSASTLDVTQGGSGSITVTASRSGGYTGAVNVSVEGLPTGVTAPAGTIAAGQTSTSLTFSAAAAAAAATSSLTIRATGTGVSAVSAALSLTVRQPAPTGGFTLGANPASVSLAQGGSATVTININRTGNFAGAVTLAVTGAATGLTPTLSATSVTGTSATITLAAAASLATGSQTLTIRGTATGATEQTLTLPVTITASQQSSGNVTWKFCGTSGLPVWLAAQDGTNTWTRVTGSADTYSFAINGARGGVAYVVPMGAGYDLEIFYGTTAELQARGNELCSGAVGAGKAVNATIAGAGATDVVIATLGRSIGTVNLTANPPVTFAGVQTGNVDLIASRSTLQLVNFTPVFTLSKMIIRRGINPAAGSTLGIDFGASEAFDPVTRNLTISNIGSEISLAVGMYLTAGNAMGAFITDIAGTSGSTRTYRGVPAANQVAGDLHVLSVSAMPSLTQTSQTRNVITVFKDAVDKTVSLGPTMTAPTISSLSGAAYGRTRAVVSVQSEYNKFFAFDVQQTTGSPRKTTVQQTAGYASGSSLTIDVPDFTGVAGFDTAWGLRTGTASTWTITATGWTGSGTTGPALTEGTSYLSGTRMGSVTP